MLHQGRFRQDITGKLLTERDSKHWNSLPEEAMAESPALQVFERCVDAVLRDVL